MWDRKELKRRGLAAFKANYWKCVLAGILLSLFVAGSSVSMSSTTQNGMNATNGSDEVSIESNGTFDEAEAEISEEEIREALQNPEVQNVMYEVFAKIGVLLFVVWLICICLRLLVFYPIEVGCRGFFIRNTEAPAGLDVVKTGFHPYVRTVGTLFLRDLFLFLWSMLFIIPGVIKRYSYRMVPYILADDPTISGMDAIALSRKMMDGHKWNTFVLDLSFIGWDLLTVLTCGLVGVFYANPYQFSTGAELYRVLKGYCSNS